MSAMTADTLESVGPTKHGGVGAVRSGGPLTLVSMEVRKLKGSSFWWMAMGMVALVSLWSGFALMDRAGDNPATRTVTLAQGDVYELVGLLAPILAALLTSRLAVMETGGRMDLKWRSLGQGESGLFLAKLAVAGTALSLVFVVPLAWTPLAASAMGFESSGGLPSLMLAPALVAFLSCMAVTAVQLMLSMTIGKQAVGLGVGVIAGLVGSGLGPLNVAQAGWLFPAGVSSAASPFLVTATPDGFARMTLVANPWALVLACLVACIVWTGVSAFVIMVKESHR